MNQDLLAALSRAFEKARSKQDTADKLVKKCEDHVLFFQNKLQKAQEQTRFADFRLQEVNRQHKALLDHYEDSDSRPPFIVAQLQELVSQRLDLGEKARDAKDAEDACKRDLVKAESQLSLARNQETEASEEIVAVNQEIQRAQNLN
jgi:hypothetical protein